MERPKILYKYRNIGENTEKILSDKKVWLSKPENLNDPFECSIANFSEKVKEKVIWELKRIRVAQFCILCKRSMDTGNPLFGLQRKAIKALLKRMETKSLDRQFKMINNVIYNDIGLHLSNSQQAFKGLDDRLRLSGIFSLSATDTNQLMWAHYGGESKGIALGFEVTDGSKLSDDKYCLPVSYCDELPSFNSKELTIDSMMTFGGKEQGISIKIPFDDPIFRKCISTKPTVWEYEKEWRYIDESDGLHPLPGKLAEIIFGLRCSYEDRLKYIDLARDNFDYPISYYEIVKKPNSNQIEKTILNIK